LVRCFPNHLDPAGASTFADLLPGNAGHLRRRSEHVHFQSYAGSSGSRMGERAGKRRTEWVFYAGKADGRKEVGAPCWRKISRHWNRWQERDRKKKSGRGFSAGPAAEPAQRTQITNFHRKTSRNTWVAVGLAHLQVTPIQFGQEALRIAVSGIEKFSWSYNGCLAAPLRRLREAGKGARRSIKSISRKLCEAEGIKNPSLVYSRFPNSFALVRRKPKERGWTSFHAAPRTRRRHDWVKAIARI